MKYTKETTEELIGLIESGNTTKDSCKLARISEETFYKWLREKSEFSESIERAKVTCKARMISTITTDAISNWKAAAWWLEHRHPNEFLTNRRFCENVETIESVVSDEEMAEITRLLGGNRK